MPLPSAVKLAVGGRGLRNEATKVISRPVQGNDVFVKPLGIRNKVRTLLSAYICFPFVCTQIKSPTKKCEACFTFALDGAAAWYEVFVVFFGCLNPPHHGGLPVYHPKRRMKRSENFISFRQTYTSTAFLLDPHSPHSNLLHSPRFEQPGWCWQPADQVGQAA